MTKIQLRFDGPPGPVSGRFVEAEDEYGRSIRVGEWVQDGDYWLLVIDTADLHGFESPAPAKYVDPDRRDQELSLELIKARRRRMGWCLLCGASRQNPGEGCYEYYASYHCKTWAPHSWPEDIPS